MINTSRLYNDPDDETDMVVFTNSNGDYLMDNGWSPDSISPWFCLPPFSDYDNRFSNRTQKVGVAIDSNNFNIIFIRNYGITSFGVSTQDGTGIGYMQFADETNSNSDKCLKGGGLLVDNGSAFDGLYFCGPIGENESWITNNVNETYFIASDSFKGVISGNMELAVEEKTPGIFSVAQNNPNPFNPTTSINFTVPKADLVTVEVYNVAGQKVDTLVNGKMSAGSHSAVWNASGKSAGVYFYTVKAGNFSKTMKMTLLK